ncbi:MAG: carboxypeptidase-like regulatory domain-containing protein [Anaerolineales bacterium]
MIRLATYSFGISLILAACNFLSPDAGSPSSTNLALDLISATPGTQSYRFGEPLSSTAIPGKCEPGNNTFLYTAASPSAEQIGVRIAGHVALNDGSSLANVSIYLSLAAYSGEQIALTDKDGDFLSGLKHIPGDENVTVWAELDGYTFQPAFYHWRHYHGLEERTLNFSADRSTSASSTQSSTASNELLPSRVDAPAAGDPPRRKHRLPEGINNGNIVLGQENRFWFSRESTKSREENLQRRRCALLPTVRKKQ